MKVPASTEVKEKENEQTQAPKMPDLKGMYLLHALNFLKQFDISISGLSYAEAPFPPFSVISQSVAPDSPLEDVREIEIVLSSYNLIRFLPSMYQSNDKLKRFLWIFQHLANSLTYKLDNLHRYFNPILAPPGFYQWLASWFSITIDFVIPETKMRNLIKNVVHLYQWRGTAHGLATYLEIITDVRPQIFEDRIPYSEYVIRSDKLIESFILEKKRSKYSFTIFFPVRAEHFPFNTIKAIYRTVESEKPAHADFYIVFEARDARDVKTGFAIGEDTFL